MTLSAWSEGSFRPSKTKSATNTIWLLSTISNIRFAHIVERILRQSIGPDSPTVFNKLTHSFVFRKQTGRQTPTDRWSIFCTKLHFLEQKSLLRHGKLIYWHLQCGPETAKLHDCQTIDAKTPNATLRAWNTTPRKFTNIWQTRRLLNGRRLNELLNLWKKVRLKRLNVAE